MLSLPPSKFISSVPKNVTYPLVPPPLTCSFPVGEVVPIPSLVLVLSQNKLLLFWERMPLVPAKRTDPAVGANHVGAPEPPEISAWPLVPTAENAYLVPSE